MAAGVGVLAGVEIAARAAREARASQICACRGPSVCDPHR